jgi:hypothetical protein
MLSFEMLSRVYSRFLVAFFGVSSGPLREIPKKPRRAPEEIPNKYISNRVGL